MDLARAGFSLRGGSSFTPLLLTIYISYCHAILVLTLCSVSGEEKTQHLFIKVKPWIMMWSHTEGWHSVQRGDFVILMFYNLLVKRTFQTPQWECNCGYRCETVPTKSNHHPRLSRISWGDTGTQLGQMLRLRHKSEKLHRSGEAVGRRQGRWVVTQRAEVRRSERGSQTEMVRDSSRCWDRTQINGSHDVLMPQAPGRQVTPPTQLLSHQDYIHTRVNVSPSP